MFKKSLSQNQERDLRFEKESFLQERLQPDSSPDAGWSQRFKRKLGDYMLRIWPAEGPPQVADPDLYVPDGSLALLIQDGRPDRWFQPGRYQLGSAKAKVEVRLIYSDMLSDQDRDLLDLALSLPYERALLYVDGVHVSIVIPGTQAERPSRKYPASSQQGLPAFRIEKNISHASISDGEDDLIQDSAFV